MPTQLSINDAATWRTPGYIGVNDAATWRQIAQVWVNNSGVWEIVSPYYNAIQIASLGGSQVGYGAGGLSPPNTGGTLLFGSAGNLGTNYGLGNLTTLMNGLWSGPGISSVDMDLWLSFTQSASNATPFSEIQVEDSTGATRRYTAASASYTFSGGFNVGYWGWGAGASHVYTAGDVGSRRWVCLMP